MPTTGTGRTVGSVAVPPGSRTRITTDNADFNSLLQRSIEDLEALQTRFPDGECPAAGVPWYVAPFGRDSLITGWQTLHLDPARAIGTLRMLGRLQGQRYDPVTGEQPGKIIHEARYGELARLKEIPHRPYYGTVDATSLFLLMSAETVAWTGDADLFDELRPAIESALRWVDETGDPDGDGLIEYWMESDPASLQPLTARHHSWKDSDDSLHHPDGREPSGHIAPVEAQGYTYAALTRLAGVAAAIGETALATDIRSKAAALDKRVNGAFWMEGEGYYAQALDGGKDQVSSISSNPGQLLFTGIVPPARARAVVERISRPDMDSGWGIRTLSSAMATYDPASYHNGSVWPHDNSLIADGCYRTGHVAMGNRLFRALFEAGMASPDGRLAELYCGHDRASESPHVPTPYPQACSPQAWAAGVYPSLIRSALGLRVDPGEGALLVSPSLPPFLGAVEIEDLRVLGTTGSVAVRRRGDSLITESSGIEIRLLPSRAPNEPTGRSPPGPVSP
jgi:glycogen debranching enzyme